MSYCLHPPPPGGSPLTKALTQGDQGVLGLNAEPREAVSLVSWASAPDQAVRSSRGFVLLAPEFKAQPRASARSCGSCWEAQTGSSLLPAIAARELAPEWALPPGLVRLCRGCRGPQCGA